MSEGLQQVAAAPELWERKSFAAGEIIFAEGAPAEHVYLVMSGQVEIVTLKPDGSILILSIVPPGRFFGEMAMFEETPKRSATAISMSGCVVSLMTAEAFKAYQANMDPFARHLVTSLAVRVRDLTKRIKSADL